MKKPKWMQIFLTMHHFFLPIKLSGSYLKIYMVFATLIVELILPSKFYVSTEYSRKIFLKIFKIPNFMNFLVKNVLFYTILASDFFFFFSMLKLKNYYETYETSFSNLQRLFRIFFKSKNQLWAYSNHLMWLWCLTPHV